MHWTFFSTLLFGLTIVAGMHNLATAQSPTNNSSHQQNEQEAVEGEAIEVAIRGMLKGGMMAIGGETTGTTVTAKGIVFEVDFDNQQRLMRLAERLDGQLVSLKGTLGQRHTPERGPRWVVSVRRLEAAAVAAPQPKGAEAGIDASRSSNRGGWWLPFDRTGLKRSEIDDGSSGK